MAAEKPSFTYLPLWGKIGELTHPLLRCESGWDDESTAAFLQHEFNSLWLTFRTDQAMHIPALGPKALCVKWLFMVGSGTVTGLEQFTNVELLSVSLFPRGGIDFQLFPKLRQLSTAWDKKYIDTVFTCRQLKELDIEEGYADEDCRRYHALPELSNVGFTGGRLRTLKGLEHCPQLETLGIAYARNFTELGDLPQLGKLTMLVLGNLPKLQPNLNWRAMPALRNINLLSLPTLTGMIEFAERTLMEEIYVVKCPGLTLDLAGIGGLRHLRKLWTDAPHIHLSLEALFSLPQLELCGFHADDSPANSDQALHALAAAHLRKISSIERAGPKKKRHLRIRFAKP